MNSSSPSSGQEDEKIRSSGKMEEREHTDEHRTGVVDGQSGGLLLGGQLQQQLQLQLQSLQLPNMPQNSSFLLTAAAVAAAEAVAAAAKINNNDSDNSRGKVHQQRQENQQDLDIVDNDDSPNPPILSSSHPLDPPTIRILVVADVDLESASALAEYAMIFNTTAASGSEEETSTTSSSRNPFGDINDGESSSSSSRRSTSIDLIIACGPFMNDDYNLIDDHRRRQDGSSNTTVVTRPSSFLPSTTTTTTPPCYYSSSTLARYYEGRARRNYLTRNYYHDGQDDDDNDGDEDDHDYHSHSVNNNDLDEDVEVIPMNASAGRPPSPSSSSSSSHQPSFFMSPPVATSYSTSTSYATSYRRMGGTGRLGPSSSSSSTPSSLLDTVAIPTPLPPRINQPIHYELVENEVPGPSPPSAAACQTRHAYYYNSRFRSQPYYTSGAVPYSTTSGQSHHHQRQSSKTTSSSRRSSKEEMASKLGLVTATISQLESIVCRVVWLPPIDSDGINRNNKDDDDDDDEKLWSRRRVRNVHELNTTGDDGGSGGDVGKSDEQQQQQQKSQQDHQHLRLTPNSRNIHNSWLSLAPGLGIAGLCHGGNAISSSSSSSSSIGGGHGRIRKNMNTTETNPDSLGATTDFYEQLKKLVVECAPQISRVSDVPREARTHPQIDELYDYNESNEDDSSSERLFQSILVTHYNDSQYGDCDDANPDVKNEGSGSPLSTKDHESLYADSTIQKNVVLQIDAGASGSGRSSNNTAHNVHSNVPVIVPGSLRKYGEFCIVDVAFMNDEDVEDDEADNNNNDAPPCKSSSSLRPPPPKPRRQGNKGCKGRDEYCWRVRRTRFHSMLS